MYQNIVDGKSEITDTEKQFEEGKAEISEQVEGDSDGGGSHREPNMT